MGGIDWTWRNEEVWGGFKSVIPVDWVVKRVKGADATLDKLEAAGDNALDFLSGKNNVLLLGAAILVAAIVLPPLLKSNKE